MLGTWLRNTGVVVVVLGALAACSNSTSGDDSPSGSKDAAALADGAANARVTGDAGQCISNCHQGDPCAAESTCATGSTCTAGVCSDPSCTDGKKDGTESAVDCGGTCTACADGTGCAAGNDCTSGVCNATSKTCAAPTATDGVKNGSETDVDCGNTGVGEVDDAPPCADNLACKTAADCVDKACGPAGTCLPATCTDKLINGNETGVDCGGSCSPCADNVGCKVNADCTSKSCDAVVTHLCLKPTASDKIQNGNETDVDCGSSGTGESTSAPPCADALKCGVGGDCADLICTAGTCAAATCVDGVKNGHETDTDCGGGTASGCNACADTLGCKVGADCTSLSCNGTKCLAPTDKDGIKNGNETDVDCGSGGAGENDGAPLCLTGKACVSHSDCVADGCNYHGVCIAEPSCAQHLGGDTCGAGETGQAGQNHESCCASLPLPAPNAATRLDKYEITAGRMREFVSRVGNDVNGFWQAFKGAKGSSPVALAQIRAQDEQYLPTGLLTPQIPSFVYVYQDGVDKNGNPVEKTATNYYLGLGIYAHLGASVIYADSPSVFQGCYVGAPSSSSYGHPTYYWDDQIMSDEFGGGPRFFTQAQLDEKSLNCVTEEMLAAFCAWDGGHLATQAELIAAWGSATYPWGASPAFYDTVSTTVPGRTNPAYSDTNGMWQTPTNQWTVNMPINDGTGDALLLAPTYTMTNWNNFYPTIPSGLRYYWPTIPNASWGEADEAYEIAAPGRFVNDKAPNPASAQPVGPLDGWFDLSGNMMETTSTVTGTADATHASLNQFSWVGGSFEGHDPTNKGGYNEVMLTKYGKAGGRCAR